MQITITDILSAELTRRLRDYRELISTGAIPKDTANHQYLCIQTALWMAEGGDPPAIQKSQSEVRAEITRWMKDIQRTSTVKTMHADGRVVALLSEFLETTKPITPATVQTSLL